MRLISYIIAITLSLSLSTTIYAKDKKKAPEKKVEKKLKADKKEVKKKDVKKAEKKDSSTKKKTKKIKDKKQKLDIFKKKFIASKAKPVGFIKSTTGKVYVAHKKKLHVLYPVTEKIKLVEGDRVKAMDKSTAKLSLKDGSIVVMAAKSELIISKFSYEPKKKERNSIFRNIFGKIRYQIKKFVDFKKSEVEVKSFTSVAAVRGSDFIISTGKGLTDVATLKNTTLDVSNTKFPKKPPVRMTDFQQSSILPDKLPSTPIKLTPEALKGLVNGLGVPAASIGGLLGGLAGAVGGAIAGGVAGVAAVAAGTDAKPEETPEPKKLDPLKIIKITPTRDNKETPIDTVVSIEFSTAIDKTTLNDNFIITQGGNNKKLMGSFELNEKTVTFKFPTQLPFDEVYIITLKFGLKGTEGETLTKEEFIRFKTVGEPKEKVQLKIISTLPVNDADLVEITTTPVITFSKPLDDKTLKRDKVTIKSLDNDEVDIAKLFVNGNKIIVRLDEKLDHNVNYIMTVHMGIKSADGDELAYDHQVMFRTAEEDSWE